jgi:hypothetical protein
MVGVIVRETTQGTRAPARFTARCFIRQRLVYGAEAGMVGVGRRLCLRSAPLFTPLSGTCVRFGNAATRSLSRTGKALRSRLIPLKSRCNKVS